MKNPMRVNKPKTMPTIIFILLLPVILPVYLLGAIWALLYITAFGGFKNGSDYFISGLGFESNEQIIRRVLKEKEL